MHRRTKIVATLGPATDAPGVLDALVAAGIDCARLNCSHGTQDELRRRAAEVRTAAARAGRPVALLADLQGPKLRLNAATAARTIAAGETVTFSGVPGSDGVMVARGDYGVEAGVARVPLMQKDTIFRATQMGKVVITATQMLESMIHAPEPTRAEATDVANAVIDGTSAVMLSAETSVGAYPVESVFTMAQIAEAAERSPVIQSAEEPREPESPADAVMHAAVTLAEHVDAIALIVPTST